MIQALLWGVTLVSAIVAFFITTRIMTGLLAPMSYAQVIYLTAPKARSVVTRAAGSLPPGDQARVVVRDLPITMQAGIGSYVGVRLAFANVADDKIPVVLERLERFGA